MNVGTDNNRQKWVMLIGINRYPNFRQLAGCVNDIEAMRQVPTDSFNFPEIAAGGRGR